jgi:hypothetical protein
MGMFDWVRCGCVHTRDPRVNTLTSYQTKDLDCCLDDYWVDPAGRMWRIDYSGTHDYVEESPADLERARAEKAWLPPFRPVPNGNRGRVVPHRLTRSITIYPSRWDRPKPDHSDWPEYELTFRDGELILFQCLK